MNGLYHVITDDLRVVFSVIIDETAKIGVPPELSLLDDDSVVALINNGEPVIFEYVIEENRP